VAAVCAVRRRAALAAAACGALRQSGLVVAGCAAPPQVASAAVAFAEGAPEEASEVARLAVEGAG
jgi:hypothetical protein